MTYETITAMLPGIPYQWIIQGGAVGLLGFVALLVFLGQLVPRPSYKQLERDRDYWRAVALKAIGHAEVLLPAAQIATELTKAALAQPSIEQSVGRALGGTPNGETPPTEPRGT